MLYKRNTENKLDEKLFQNPSSEYRGTPFWAWNCQLNQEQLDRQIEYLKEMGFGGFHMHSRTGMAVEYLSDEFMDLIRGCTDKAEKEGMLAWLYDEDRWPSGAAGGIVTKNPRYRQRGLLFTVTENPQAVALEQAVETGETGYLACYDIVLDEDGNLKKYQKIEKTQEAKGTKWYAYMITYGNQAWYNGQAYIDTLDPEAMQEFIRVTYDRYLETVGDRFDKTVPAIFTDEPQFLKKNTLAFPQDQTDVILPWTPTMTESYYDVYKEDLLEKLPELFWDLPGGAVSVCRYHFHDHVTNLFSESFAGQCGRWCEEHGLRLTGHMVEEPSLRSQTAMIGEAMRSYPYFQIPGIDMLCDHIEFSTAKQTQSVVHQSGREAMLSELYGVTGWDFDFRGHKFQGDWQAALGVTVRVPHLSWVSMGGEAKRDYPASINYQSPWYKEYPYVENHFARVNTAMTRGKAVVRVGVIHPIESYWLHWGPAFTTAAIRTQMDERFQSIIEWLLTGCIDFDFISEALLPQQCPSASAPLQVGEMAYDTIVVPLCETLRESTLCRLRTFAEQGGKLLFLGEPPQYMDAVPSQEPAKLYKKVSHVPFDKTAVLEALDYVREIEIRNVSGEHTNNLIYQLRQDTECRWLFIAHAKRCVNKDIAAEMPQKIQLTIHRKVKPVLYDTLTGQIRPLSYRIERGASVIDLTLQAYDSILLQLNDTEETGYRETQPTKEKIFETTLHQTVAYHRTEPNVLLLDTAQYALDNEEFQPEEEILRLDNICRQKLGWPRREGDVVQPWVIAKEKISHFLSLRFEVECKQTFHNIKLALENAENAEIMLNGQAVPSVICGYYVDEAIQTVELPSFSEGKNILQIKIPFGKRTDTEWCYLLGEFDTVVRGTCKYLTAPSQTIGFGDISRQGLAFYGGNVIYETELEVPAGDMKIHVSHYRGAMIRVAVDGKDCGVIAYAPYDAEIKGVAAGRHKITLTLFGNRFNTFGALHDVENALWVGPNIWRTTGDKWCYEYRLRETGILSAPVIRMFR